MNQYLFQYCPKIAVFTPDRQSLLLCKRKGEADYDGVFSLIGGKMEITDGSIIDALRREKNEEVGAGFNLNLLADYSVNAFFVKKDGNSMVLPHYYAEHREGDIDLNDEYSEYRWIAVGDIDEFEPKISNIPEIVAKLLLVRAIVEDDQLAVI